jgi:formylglycine-generating enzyme required for sulfatase activity
LPAHTGTGHFREEDYAWCIGRTPVTNEQYKNFAKHRSGKLAPRGEVYIRKGGATTNLVARLRPENFEGWLGPFEPWEHPEFSDPDQPVVCISFDEAEAYASWLSTSSHASWLSTKQFDGRDFFVTPHKLWDFAAFGKLYPVYDRGVWKQAVIHDKAETPAPVSNAEDRTTPFGAVDMLGNIWEWCSDGVIGQELAALGPPNELRVSEIRGGSYLDDLSVVAPFLNVSIIPHREGCKHSDLGFRVANLISIEALPSEVAERVCRGSILPFKLNR